jgi:hypothetical protein
MLPAEQVEKVVFLGYMVCYMPKQSNDSSARLAIPQPGDFQWHAS